MTAPAFIRRRALAAVLGLALCLPALSRGQEPEPPEGRAGAGAVRPAELAAMLDAYVIVEAQSALRLGDAQYGQFVPRLKRLQDVRRRDLRLRNRLLQELRALTAATSPDDNALRQKLKALRDHDTAAALALRREEEALDEVLDARQQALFRLFEERMERQKLDLLMRARARAGRAAGPRRGGGG